MEILTLLKANIRRKKGSFISVILLTFIVTVSIVTILSIWSSVSKGVERANQICDTPDISVFYDRYDLTDDLITKIENDSRVERTNISDVIYIRRSFMNDSDYSNTQMLLKDSGDIKLLTDDLQGIKDSAPKLKKGEIYVPQGLLNLLNGKTGEKIILETISCKYEFTVKNVLLEPQLGASMIGRKQFYISEEDFEQISLDILAAEEKDKTGLGKVLDIYKADNCGLSDGQLRRELNLDTGLTDMSFGSITKELSVNYTTLFPKVVSYGLTAFAVLLLIIVIIITVHSVLMEIETSYVTFGVLKAQGFNKYKIRLLFIAQYLIAEIIGAAAGILLSVPLIKLTSNVFINVTAIPAVISIPLGVIALILSGLFVLSYISIFLATIKINRIVPVRAISGAKKEIYFESRIKAPVSKRFLSLSIAFRQFTSAKRRYAGTLVITAILSFFMMMITSLVNTVASEAALENMGALLWQIRAAPKTDVSESQYSDIEQEIERYTKIEKAVYTVNAYISFEGEEIMCCIFKDTDVIPVLKGRLPKYDNEIAVSPILLDEFDLKIGSEVILGYQGQKDKYIISGTVQMMNDTGKCFITSYDAVRKIGFDQRLWGCYLLKNGNDQELLDTICADLNEKYGDIIDIDAEDTLLDDDTENALKIMQILIYVFSFVFSLVSVYMICSKAFVLERKDIGIYKALGFETSVLRRQFALRFFIVSLIGSLIGETAGYFQSGKILSMLLREIGLIYFEPEFNFSSFAVPAVVVCLSFFIFSYLVSSKIRKVRIRELVAE